MDEQQRRNKPRGTGETLDLGLFREMLESVIGRRGARLLLLTIAWVAGGILLAMLSMVLFDWSTVTARLLLLGWLALPVLWWGWQRLRRRR